MICPETPFWYMTKGRHEEAKDSLIRLRGAQNMDIVEEEFNRILVNIKIQEKEDQSLATDQNRFKQMASEIPYDMSFWKPFAFLVLLFAIGMEWAGFPAIGFYMVPLLKKSKIPMDPFWASALVASYR